MTARPEADIASQFSGRRVLITGGLGFIGSNLAQALVPAGARVVLLDAALPQYGANRFNLNGIEPEVEVRQEDIRDWAAVSRAARGADFVFHLAGQVSYLDAKGRPFDDLDFNGRGTLTVLEAVRTEAPQARVLFASSRLVYGKIRALPVREDHPTEPLSLYGIHKLLGEKYIRYFAETFGVHGVAARIPNPYGPRQQMKHSKYSIVGWFIRQALEGKTLTIYGDGLQERDYLYIDDLVEAFLQLARNGAAGEVYNVGTHERVKFGEMVAAVLTAVGGGRKEFVPWPADYEKNETGDYIADTSKLHALTGWEPRVLLAEGVARTVAYYREFREYYWS